MSSVAESYVASLDPLGWNLGLGRIRRLCSLLGMPQNRFASVHVVGTNGKSSVARMTAALLAAEGQLTGAYVSPHIGSWRERILVGGAPISEQEFAVAVEHCREAAVAADRAAGDDGPVTQFEFVTAVAFWAFAAAGLEFAAIEAGLGGRLDATNVIPSAATALTSVGLDHQDWLGETIEEIATEKLAVLRDHTALVVGALPPKIESIAERVAAERQARLIRASEPPDAFGRLVPMGYYRANLGVALAAAEVVLGRTVPVEAAPALAGRLIVPGRAELIDGNPPIVLDAAHNPDGAAALAQAFRELTGQPKAVACIAVLADKDANGIAAALAPICDAVIATEIPPEAIAGSGRPGGTSVEATKLAALFATHGVGAEARPDVASALAEAQRMAAERGLPVLLCGSHYLLKVARSSMKSG